MKKVRIFWMVTFALAITFFASQMFAQVVVGGINKGDRVDSSVGSQIDSVAQCLSSLQEEIINEMGLGTDVVISDGINGPVVVRNSSTSSSTTALCDSKLQLYANALNSLNNAWGYVSSAYDAYNSYIRTNEASYLIAIGQYLSQAWIEIFNASQWLLAARSYSCVA